eukprot:EG_transcript_33213
MHGCPACQKLRMIIPPARFLGGNRGKFNLWGDSTPLQPTGLWIFHESGKSLPFQNLQWGSQNLNTVNHGGEITTTPKDPWLGLLRLLKYVCVLTNRNLPSTLQRH